MSTAYSDGLPFQPTKGLIHLSGDNFEAEIHTQNCKTTCHVLALVAGKSGNPEPVEHPSIPRISKAEMSIPIPWGNNRAIYNLKIPVCLSLYGHIQQGLQKKHFGHVFFRCLY